MQIHDKTFSIYINSKTIKYRIKDLGREIEEDYRTRKPLFISILNGSFVFAADLLREINIPVEIFFIKLSSYDGMVSTGEVKGDMEIGNLEGRHIIVIEDIVDTGTTLHHFLKKIKEQNPKSVAIATLLHKPEALKHKLSLKYVGFNIPDKFVVGYGLDIDGEGRNLKDIYQLKSEVE